MDWLDLLAVQGTLKSLLQHHSSKASICQRSAFFTVQLSHPSYQRRMRRRGTQEERGSSHPLLDLSLSDLMNFRLVVGGEMSPVTLGPSVCLLLTAASQHRHPCLQGRDPQGGWDFCCAKTCLLGPGIPFTLEE